MKQNYVNSKNYIKICKDSGCISAFYNTNEDYDNKITLITSDSPEVSGAFLVSRNGASSRK